jgi:uncharacterized protein YbjT (DUF2867 family)
MRIIVAGAAGNLGYEVTSVLSEHGHDVVAIDRNIQRLEPMRASLAGLHTVDLRQPEGLENLLAKADVVVTTVGIGRPQKLTDFHDVDYQSNLNLLNAAKKAGIQNFIYISVAGVDTDLSVPLLKAKHDFEAELTGSGLHYLIIRPSSYFTDVWRTFMTSARKGSVTLIKTDEDYYFSPVHPRDVAEFIAANLTPGDRIVNVGGPENFTYPEISNLCFELLNQPPKLKLMSVSSFKTLLFFMKPIKPALWSVFRFLLWASTTDLTCPPIGSRTVQDYLREQLASQPAPLS